MDYFWLYHCCIHFLRHTQRSPNSSKLARQIWECGSQGMAKQGSWLVSRRNTVRTGGINHQKNRMCIKNLKYPQADGFKLEYESNFHPCIGRGDKPHSNHRSTFRLRQSPGHLVKALRLKAKPLALLHTNFFSSPLAILTGRTCTTRWCPIVGYIGCKQLFNYRLYGNCTYSFHGFVSQNIIAVANLVQTIIQTPISSPHLHVCPPS